MGWKTIVGSLIWGAGQLFGPDVGGAVNETVSGALQAFGGVMAIIGGRHAITKLGQRK